jgi:carbonic anhydrase
MNLENKIGDRPRFSPWGKPWSLPVFLTICSFAGIAVAGEQPHWTYSGSHGPANWGDLSPDYVQCKVGVNQSPIDITNPIAATLPALQVNYASSTTTLVNNGHTAQANVAPGSYFMDGDEKFELVQFHMHAPSEHRVDGKLFLMETHFVHQNASGQLAVVAVLHGKGDRRSKMKGFVAAVPTRVNEPVPYSLSTSSIGLAYGDTAYYRYNGSLTTPPCSEGVRWYVMKQPRPISVQQQQAFIKLIGEDARGPQPLNARLVLQ